VTGLTRRLAFLLYLNKDWKHAYGGQLELWNDTATLCEKVIEPIFNRVVLFEIADKNYHAVRPVTPNTGVCRQSFVVYYHTVGKGIIRHNSVFAPAIYRDPVPLTSRVAREVLPPILFRAIKNIREAH
jgi:hypothetical protein